jgi:hypothetical protein
MLEQPLTSSKAPLQRDLILPDLRFITRLCRNRSVGAGWLPPPQRESKGCDLLNLAIRPRRSTGEVPLRPQTFRNPSLREWTM